MKLWHRFNVWLVRRKIRAEHRELAKYIRRSAHEINAWKQDIGFLEETLAFHQSHFAKVPPEVPAAGKVVPMENTGHPALRSAAQAV